MKINFHETYTVGARSWSAPYKGYRADIIRINGGYFPTFRVFVYDENGKEIANPPDIDGDLADAAREARVLLRSLRDPLGD